MRNLLRNLPPQKPTQNPQPTPHRRAPLPVSVLSDGILARNGPETARNGRPHGREAAQMSYLQGCLRAASAAGGAHGQWPRTDPGSALPVRVLQAGLPTVGGAGAARTPGPRHSGRRDDCGERG